MTLEWNRASLWSEHDARHERRMRRDMFTLVSMVTVVWFGLSLTSYACNELYMPDDRVYVPATVEPIQRECLTDRDCTLVPSLFTCCGECEATPPFEAAPRAIVAQLRHENLAACATSMLAQSCEPPVCPGLPAGCDARPICQAGECRVEANDRCTWTLARGAP